MNEQEKKRGVIIRIDEFPDEPNIYKSDDEFLQKLTSNPIAIIGKEAMVEIRHLDPFAKEFSTKYAYLYDGYFYLYRGVVYDGTGNGMKPLVPGIYYEGQYRYYFLVRCDPENPEHDVFKATPDHILSVNPESIVSDLETNEKEIYAPIKSTRVFVPEVNLDDDILKRVTKMVLQKKGIDLDRYRDRFPDKNALFNYKQVLKGKARLSMLVFGRGMEALGLKYRIIVEDIDPENCIGDPLGGPIEVSSEDTYDL